MKLQDIEKHFGSRKAAGEALGKWRGKPPVTRAAFTTWAQQVPLGVQAEFQILTGGKLQVERRRRVKIS